MNSLLILIFAIHFGVAFRLFIKKRRCEYAVLMGVFLCLITSVPVRVYMPDLYVLNIHVLSALRYAAIGLSIISVGRIIQTRVKGET